MRRSRVSRRNRTSTADIPDNTVKISMNELVRSYYTMGARNPPPRAKKLAAPNTVPLYSVE